MTRRWTLAALSRASRCAVRSLVAWTAVFLCPACHVAPSRAEPPDDAAFEPARVADQDGARPQVQLTWRLYETQRWLDGQDRHESAIVELLVNGGSPARVQLGRRDTAGCLTRDAVGRPPEDAGGTLVTSLDCPAASAQVLRSTDSELRVVANDGRSNGPGAVTSLRVEAANVRIPANAEITVDPALLRIPDEAPGF